MSILLKQYIEEKYIKKTRFDYGSFQVNIDDVKFLSYLNNLKRIIKTFDSRNLINLENDPHITVLYGIKNVTRDDIKNSFFKLKKMKEFDVNIGDVTLFKNKEDVILLKCESDILIKLNNYFKKLPYKKTHGTYIPHLTLAYVKSGTGEDYIKVLKKYIKKGKIRIKFIYYSNEHGNTIRYKLKENKTNDK